MEKVSALFHKKDLERAETHIRTIQEACIHLKALSDEKGGVPFMERNIVRIQAPLNILAGICELLDVMREQ